MSQLVHNSYGKSRVRLTRVVRREEQHDLKEVTVAIELQGDFADTYLQGDNAKVVATDTMKNTVYALARNHPLDTVEDFSITLADHFLERYQQVSRVRVDLEEDSWQRLEVDGEPYPATFVGGSKEKRTVRVVQSKESREVWSGLKDLLVMKTTDSSFTGFPRDSFTILPETEDRILATSITAEWIHKDGAVDWNDDFQKVREAMLRVFAQHFSLSVQQTLYLMGEAALKASPLIEEITIKLPNAHRLLVNLEPMGMDNPNEIFVPTDQPYGLITGTLRR